MAYRIESLERATPQRLEYWGGFFDETLYFDIDHHIDKHPRSADPTLEDNIIYDPLLSIHSSRKPILESLFPVIPGKVLSDYSDPKDRTYVKWALKIKKQVPSFRFLQLILPYLDYKHEQATVLLQFLRQKREVRREIEGLIKVPRYPTPEDRIAVEEKFRAQLIEAKTVTADSPHLPTRATRLAGIIDASVVLGITTTKRSTKLDNDYQAHCSLISVHRGLLEGLYLTYGGTQPVKEGERPHRYAGPSYLWQLDGQKMLPLLKRVEPYLIFRQTEVRLMIDFLTLRPFMSKTSPDPFIDAQRNRVLQGYVDQWQELTQLRSLR